MYEKNLAEILYFIILKIQIKFLPERSASSLSLPAVSMMNMTLMQIVTSSTTTSRLLNTLVSHRLRTSGLEIMIWGL